MKRTYFLNGKFIKESQAKVEVDNLGILRAYGVFDYIRTYNKTPFHLDDHLRRFFSSAKKLNLKVPFGKREIKEIIFKLIEKNKNLKELSFRIVLTGGKTFDGKTSKTNNFFIIVSSPHYFPEILFKKGIKLVTLNYQRPLAEIKSLNYALSCANWKKALRRGAKEILYISGNQVLECSTSNFFIVKNKILKTPKKGVLEGITKKIVIKLAKKIGLEVKEKTLFFKEVLGADEAFITATDKEVLPVVKIDKYRIGKGRVGEISKKLIEAFREYVRNKSANLKKELE